MKELTLTASEREHLRKASLQAGLYCQGCGACVGQCASGLPIPDLMRAHMYVYGHRNLTAAQDIVLSLALPEDACGRCSSCAVTCTNGWAVRDRVRDIVRLRDVPPGFVA